MSACSSDKPKTKAADTRACDAIVTVNKQLNSISDDLAASKTLFGQIKQTAVDLVAAAPPSLKLDADKLNTAISTAKPYIDRARSIEQLHQLEQSSARLQAALSDMLVAGTAVGEWKSANCKK